MTFAEAEERYHALKKRFTSGDLSEADFKAQLQDLMLEDEQGHWWMIGYETGQWYMHDGKQWMPAEPPRQAPEAAPSESRAEPEKPILQPLPAEERQPTPAPKRGGHRLWLWIGAGIVGLIALVIVIRQIKPSTSAPTATPTRPAEVTRVLEPTKTSEPAKIPEPTKAPEAGPPPAGIVTRIMAPSCDYEGELQAIEALDDYTVRFTLCYSDVGFAAKVALPPFGIHPAEYLIATGGTGELLRAPIGTGPYGLERWDRDELRLKANPNYWDEPAKIPHLQFHWNPDADARLRFLTVADVDSIDNPPPETYAEIQNNADLRFYPRAGLNTGYLGISNGIKPFDDIRVRRAVALAISREWLVENTYPPGTIVATHFTPCSISGACDGESWHDFDPEMARMLLAEAGYPDGFETELVYYDAVHSYLPEPTQIAQAIADMLGEHLNIHVKLRVIEPDSFREAAWSGNLPLYLLGWDADYPHLANFLNPNWSEFGTKRFEDGFPEIWDTLRQAMFTASPVSRAELYTLANNLIKRDVPLVPLVHVGSAAAFRASVGGAHSSPMNLERFAAMSLEGDSTLVWKQATEPYSLYCADETEIDTWRACAQITESLLAFSIGSTEVVPALAERYEPNEDLTAWTFHLRRGVKFHDGSELDAGDVVTSWAVMWDESNPLHKGRTGGFDYFQWLFNAFLNAQR